MVWTDNAETNNTSGIDGNTDDASTNSIYGSAKIGRRKVLDVGLAAIGVGDPGNGQLDSQIWRGTSAREAVLLLQRGAGGSQSQAIMRLGYEVVARRSVPLSLPTMLLQTLLRRD